MVTWKPIAHFMKLSKLGITSRLFASYNEKHSCLSSVCNTLLERCSIRLYKPYLAQWPGPSPERTNLKMTEKT